jgi:predicted negative regulator of RcsB-dependent stress response
MTTPASPAPNLPAGDDRNLVAAATSPAVTFEDRVRSFWTGNRNVITGLCVGVALAIVAKGGWDYLQGQQEAGVVQAYAAADSSDKVKAFAAAHPGHPLAGIAQLRMADEAYQAGKAADAAALYQQAATNLKGDPLASRARMGRAVAQLAAGQAAEAAVALKALADDSSQLKAVRAEAAYHLASLAVEAKNADEAQRLVDQLMQIDVSSPWTQQAMMRRASLPAIPAPATAPAAPVPAGAGAGVEVKLPGK